MGKQAKPLGAHIKGNPSLMDFMGRTWVLSSLLVSIFISFTAEAAVKQKATHAASSGAKTSQSCRQYIDELKAMEQAQTQIMNSLVNNHETMASHLEGYSLEIQKQIKPGSSQAIASELNKSANSFRDRGVRAKIIASNFHHSSDELLKKVMKCLEK